MNNLATTTHTLDIARQTFTPEQIHLLKTQIAAGCTDDELSLFVHVAQKRGLDPFAKQIYAIKRKAKNSAGQYEEKMSIQTGIDGFRLVAVRAGCEAIDDVVYTYDAPAKGPSNPVGLVSAKVCVWRKGVTRATEASAYWDEYRQQGPQGLSRMWRDMPRVMLGKCAEALALRKAFPEELSGLYTVDEMGQAENVPIQPPPPSSAPLKQARDSSVDATPVDETLLYWQQRIEAAPTLAALVKVGQEIGGAGLPPKGRATLEKPYYAARARLKGADDELSAALDRIAPIQAEAS